MNKPLSLPNTTQDLTYLEQIIREKKLILWQKGNLRYLMHAGQRLINDAVVGSGIKNPVVLAARRYGKSTLGLIKCCEQCLRFRRTISRFMAPTIEQAKEIAFSIMEKIKLEDPASFVEYIKSDNLWRVGESFLILGGFDTNRENKRGGEASLIILDEEGSANSERYNYVIKSVLSPQLLHTKGDMWHLGTVPEQLDHPFLIETVAQAESEGNLFKFNIYENPILDQEQINQAIKDSGGLNSEHFKREYLNLYVKSETKLVIPEFDSDKHICDHSEQEQPEHMIWCISGDMGGIRDKHALLFGYYDFLKNKIIIEYERTWEINTPTQIIMLEYIAMKADKVNHKMSFDEYLDAMPQALLDINTNHKTNFQLPLKDDLGAAINNLRKLFLQNDILIHKRCKETIANLEYGMWNDKRTDFLRTKKFGHNDILMALVYLGRMIDRTTNPYPARFYHRENYYQKDNSVTQKTQLSNLFKGKK